MRRVRSPLAPAGLIALLLGGPVLFGGCGATASVAEGQQPPPKNRVEGLQRIGEANQKHDQETAAVKKPKR